MKPFVISEPPGLDADSATAYEDTLRERSQQECSQLMTEAVTQFQEAGLEVEPLIISGNPAEEIVRIADNREVSLIVVGATGGQASHRHSCSVSADVIHRAHQPVLVVRGSESQ